MAGLLGAAALAAAEVGSSFLQKDLNDRSRRDAQDWESNQYATRYQRQVADLKAAGLNPMLAYMTGAGSAPSSSAQSVQKPDVSSSVIQAGVASAQTANIRQDTVKKAAETMNIDQDTFVKAGMVREIAARTSAALASAEQSAAMADEIRVTIPKVIQEIDRIKMETQKAGSDIQLNESLIRANEFLNSLRQAETVLTGRKAESERQAIVAERPRTEAYEKAGDEGRRAQGRAAMGADMMSDFFRMLNPFKGGR